MNAPVTPLAGLTDEQTRAVLAAAVTAPSLYGTQPWQLKTDHHGIGLHLDRERLLPVADPDHKQALLACGAALLHLRLAIRVLDRHAGVQLLPTPAEPDLLAVVRPQGHHPALPAEHRLAAALLTPTGAGTGFRPAGALTAARSGLHRAAATEQAWLVIATSHQRAELQRLLTHAHQHQTETPGFLAEYSRHTGPSNADRQVEGTGMALLPPRPDTTGDEQTLTAVIGSFQDTTRSRLQAGQAGQRVALTAAAEGLTTTSLAPVVQVPDTRAQLRTLLGGGVWPQAVLHLSTFPATEPLCPDRCQHDATGSSA